MSDRKKTKHTRFRQVNLKGVQNVFLTDDSIGVRRTSAYHRKSDGLLCKSTRTVFYPKSSYHLRVIGNQATVVSGASRNTGKK